MEHKCIYCGASTDLSESDIIPDALTNARILNKNVCRIAHNNKFSDLFESDVISALSFITNELDIKSHRSPRYAAYKATVTIDGETYNASMRGDNSILDGRILESQDKKSKFGLYEKVVEIAKDPNLVKPLDLNTIKIEKSVSINTAIYFSTSMFRMVAKIAYEWYCVRNNVIGYHQEFEKIVSYITTGAGDCPVSIIQTDELYQMISAQLNLGSHALFAFESKNGQIEVVVSLFGILMYRVVVADAKPIFCSKNFLFVELRTDSSRKEIEHESLSAAKMYFFNHIVVEKINGATIIVPKASGCSPDIHSYPFVFQMMMCFDNIRADTQDPNQTVNQILFKQIQEITHASLFHKKSMKRFVSEHFNDEHKPIRLNTTTSNKKAVTQFYIVFMVARSGLETLDDSSFQHLLKSIFTLNTDNEFIITDELAIEFKKKILTTPGYSDVLERGAEIIKAWT